MTLQDRLRQLARFHHEHGLRYVHPKFGEQTMATMVAEIEEAADALDRWQAALEVMRDAPSDCPRSWFIEQTTRALE